jgi:hypothetical protein
VEGYGRHQPVSGLPLWIGKESHGEPAAYTDSNGEFTLTNLPVGLVDVVDSHLRFQVPISSATAMVDLGVIKYPLIHSPVYYWWTPGPLPSLTALLTQGQPVEFVICQTDTDWQRPSEELQRDKVWRKRPFSQQAKESLKWWFEQPAVLYDTRDVFVQSFPDGPNLGALASDWRYLLGLWTGQALTSSQCAYDASTLERLLLRQQIEIWLLGYQANAVQRLEQHFVVQVKPARGFQIIRIEGSGGPLSVHIVKGGTELTAIPEQALPRPSQ